MRQLIAPSSRIGDGEGRNRTGDTTIFSRVLYQLSYLATRRPSVAPELSLSTRPTCGSRPASKRLRGRCSGTLRVRANLARVRRLSAVLALAGLLLFAAGCGGSGHKSAGPLDDAVGYLA